MQKGGISQECVQQKGHIAMHRTVAAPQPIVESSASGVYDLFVRGVEQIHLCAWRFLSVLFLQRCPLSATVIVKLVAWSSSTQNLAIFKTKDCIKPKASIGYKCKYPNFSSLESKVYVAIRNLVENILINSSVKVNQVWNLWLISRLNGRGHFINQNLIRIRKKIVKNTVQEKS